MPQSKHPCPDLLVSPSLHPVRSGRLWTSDGLETVWNSTSTARKVLPVTIDETTIQVHDGPHLLVTAPRTTSLVVTHKRAQHH
ncbi:hypothetical protein [Lentzea sp. E54]|uniref:hypothetical protein n=1 Tax=Lentzea xerophila TaxID=3435883 RepID=UPI003DA416F8